MNFFKKIIKEFKLLTHRTAHTNICFLECALWLCVKLGVDSTSLATRASLPLLDPPATKKGEKGMPLYTLKQRKHWLKNVEG